MEGLVDQVGWPIDNSLPTKWPPVNNRSDTGPPAKDRRPNSDVNKASLVKTKTKVKAKDITSRPRPQGYDLMLRPQHKRNKNFN